MGTQNVKGKCPWELLTVKVIVYLGPIEASQGLTIHCFLLHRLPFCVSVHLSVLLVHSSAPKSLKGS